MKIIFRNIQIVLDFEKSDLGTFNGSMLIFKAVTYDEGPKMKRDTREKSSLFLSKRLLFSQVSLFIFGRSSYVTALLFKGNFCILSIYVVPSSVQKSNFQSQFSLSKML